MRILSIDTSSEICAVALLEDDKLIKEIVEKNGLTHSERLMPIIKRLLSETHCELKDIDLLVCDKGPGSFTGIRIGVATAKAFSDSLNIPSIGISSLEALSYNANTNNTICSLIDARNDNCYYGLFKNYNIINIFECKNINNILEDLKNLNTSVTFVGNGSNIYREKILQMLPDSHFCGNNDLSAYNLGLAGLYNFKKINKQTEILPLYLRAPKAEQLMEAKKNG